MLKNVLILLPYGNLKPLEKRYEQLNQLVEKLKSHCKKLSEETNNHIKYKIFLLVSEQIEPKTRFNKGVVLNAGVLYFKRHIGNPAHLIIHDIDFLPDYTLFKQYLITHPSFSLLPNNTETYKKIYIDKMPAGGSIYTTTMKNYFLCNGMPNNFWGWGGEDNVFHKRMIYNKIYVTYNDKGDFVSTDTQRKSDKDKMEYIEKNNLKVKNIWALMKKDKTDWKKNGIVQSDKFFKIVEDNVKKIYDNLSIIHIKLNIKHD